MSVVVLGAYRVKKIRSLNQLLCPGEICYITWVYHTFYKITDFHSICCGNSTRSSMSFTLDEHARQGQFPVSNADKIIKLALTDSWENHHTLKVFYPKIQLCVSSPIAKIIRLFYCCIYVLVWHHPFSHLNFGKRCSQLWEKLFFQTWKR